MTAAMNSIRNFMKLESSGGIALLLATFLAMLVANSQFNNLYNALFETKLIIQIGEFAINKPLLLWINDGLMAIFFFLTGLEIKREFMDGELSSPAQIVLPAFGALGGMIVPALIYLTFNWHNSAAMSGWAIPMATDIAFAMALLGVFGTRAPTSLKVFLLTLAIFDDLAAIIVIALFYSGDLALSSLILAGLILLFTFAMNRIGVTRTSVYILLGIALWVAVLKSGVHATLAGVLIAFCVPMRDQDGNSPLKELEHNLHSPVAFAILPVFAFANAGISWASISLQDVLHPVSLGITSGLFLGKPLGILLFSGIAIGTGIAKLPKNTTWVHMLGVSWVCGIGFTMSLFISGLAFEHNNASFFSGDRIGIVVGSFLSAAAAYFTLKLSLPRKNIS